MKGKNEYICLSGKNTVYGGKNYGVYMAKRVYKNTM
jgi:hypothetical protein